MTASDPPLNQPIRAQDLLPLPEPVQRYLHWAGVVGQQPIQTARVRMTGWFQTGPDKPRLDMSAVQIYTSEPPGFLWDAWMKMKGLPMVRVRDTYRAGHGRMYARMLGLIPYFDVSGPAEIDLGAMIRYFGEMIWFPTAYLAARAAWRPCGPDSAEASFSDAGRSAAAVFTFDGQGRPLEFSAMRPRDTGGGTFDSAPWCSAMSEYREFAGINVPTAGQVTWKLPAGDFTYISWRVSQIDYNLPVAL